ncbi:ISSpo8, transposase [mine drainage metagenome]|uniref:ISSpo8, transposase n=3 Tax=mine drainage metagenome TaxID=410659 RepID=T1C3Z0_9ZZZZ
MAEAILHQPQFQNAEKAREYLEALRWPNGAVCPHCGSCEQHYKLGGKAHRPGLYKCSDCRAQFTVTVGTLFADSKVSLNKWLQACYLISASKKDISSKQLERMLGVTYKTAWFMSHRIREAMAIDGGGLLGGRGDTAEVDETYWGNTGKQRKGARGYAHKMKVVSLVERNGSKRSFHVANVSAATVRPILKAQLHDKSRLMTDESSVYTKVGREFAQHGIVTHSTGEYVRNDVTTNTVESRFAVLKRGLYGTFHHVSEKHLQRYATEFDFRWNHRAKMGYTDSQRADAVLRGIAGKRLTYRHS